MRPIWMRPRKLASPMAPSQRRTQAITQPLRKRSPNSLRARRRSCDAGDAWVNGGRVEDNGDVEVVPTGFAMEKAAVFMRQLPPILHLVRCDDKPIREIHLRDSVHAIH